MPAAGKIRRGRLARPQDPARFLRLPRRQAGPDAVSRSDGRWARTADILLDVTEFFEFVFDVEEAPQLLAGDEFSTGRPKRYDKSNIIVILEIGPRMVEFFDQDVDAQAVANLEVPPAFVAQFEKYFTLTGGEFFPFGPRN